MIIVAMVREWTVMKMREILFRGKRMDNGEWETGSLVIIRGGCSDKEVFIADKMTGYHTPVIPETVGQYTGVTDKNGVKIFEGDIVREFGGETYQGCYEIDNVLIVKIPDMLLNFVIGYDCEREIIGNIHDNPELLKE